MSSTHTMYSMRRLALGGLIAIAATLALTGCGGGESEDFVAQYNEAVEPVRVLTQDAGTSVAEATRDPNRAAEAARTLSEIADEMQAAGGRLRKLDPPGDSQAQLDSLVRAVDSTAASVGKMAEEVEGGDASRISAAAQDVAQSGPALTEAENALKAAVDAS